MSLPAQYAINWDSDPIGSTAVARDVTCKLGKLEQNVDQLYDAFVDEDAMTSDSDAKIPSQQSVKAYCDLMLKTDGTKGRILRLIHVAVTSVDANTIGVVITNTWNGVALTAANIDDGATVSGVTAGANSLYISLSSTALGKTPIAAWGNCSKTTAGAGIFIYAQVTIASSAIKIATIDMTAGAAYSMSTGTVVNEFDVMYVTSD